MPCKEGGSPLFRHTIRAVIQILGGLGIGLFIAILLTAWRLSSGPVSLTFLTPYLEAAVNDSQERQVQISIDDTILTWAGWARTLDIRVINARMFAQGDGEIATFPEISISFSAKALLRGTLAPRSIEFFGPALLMVRHEDGQYDLGLDNASGDSAGLVEQLLGVLLLEADSDRPMSYLTRVSIVSGEITYIDNALGVTWHAPEADAQIRRLPTGLKAELSLGLDVNGKISEVSILGEYDKRSERMDFGISFDRVNPAHFAALSDEVSFLAAMDIPLSGTLTLSMATGGAVEGVSFDLEGGKGHLGFPVPLASRMGLLEWAQRVAVDGFKASGRFEGDTTHLTLNNLDVQLSEGGSLYLPPPLDHALPVRSFNVKGGFLGDKNLLALERLTVDLGGPKATIVANISGVSPVAPDNDGEPPIITVQLSGAIEAVAFDDLDRFWPTSLAPGPRNWILQNISQGTATRAEVGLVMTTDKTATQIQHLEGKISARGMQVAYLSSMPPVVNADASATFDATRFDIAIQGGKGGDSLTVRGGRVSFLGLDQNDQDADIEIEVGGEIRDFLRLINSKPLGFADEIGLNPDETSGYAVSKLALKFPLRLDLDLEHISANVTSEMVNAKFSKAIFDRDLTDGELKLSGDTKSISVIGKAKLGGVPVTINWVHGLSEGALFKDQYEITGDIKNVLSLRDLGVNVPDVIGRYIGGGAVANVNYTIFGDNTAALSTRVDLAKIALAAPEIGWSKAQGVPASATLEMRFRDNTPIEIPSVEVTAPDMVLRGSAKFKENGDLEVLTLNEAKSGRTSVSGSLVPLDNGAWEVTLIGDSFDASYLWDDFLGVGKKLPDKGLEETELVFSAAADIHKLWLGEDRSISDFVGTVYRVGTIWKKIDIEGRVGEADSIKLGLETSASNRRRLLILSNNAGAGLHSLNLYDNVLGGNLSLDAYFAGVEKNSPISGRLTVRDYALREAPALAQLIGVLSMTVVLDALKGDGLNFDLLDIPFTLNDGVLTIKDGRTSGPSLGLTGSGTADLRGKALDIKGTVVPAYAVNALLGNLPIIGSLLTGPEKGSGLFAATYTMKGQGADVAITINPLSALAPGLLRRLFEGGDKAGKKVNEAKPADNPADNPKTPAN